MTQASRRGGYTLMEVTVSTALVAAAMGIAFSMMSTITKVTEEEIRRSTARTSFERLDDRLYQLLSQAKIEVDSSMTPNERIDQAWIEFRIPSDTGDGNGLQDGLSPDLRWGAPKIPLQQSAAHSGGIAQGKMRFSFVPSFEVIDENYENVAAYKVTGNVYLDSIIVPKLTERTGGTGGVPLEGTNISFLTTTNHQWTVYNPRKQNLNTTWERNVIDTNNYINPTAKFGLVDRLYLGLIEIKVILFTPGSTTPLAASLQPKPSYFGGVMDLVNNKPIKGSCYLAVPESVAYAALMDREGIAFSGSYKLDNDVDGDARPDPIFSEACRWYPKDTSGQPVGTGVINAIGIKFLVVKKRPDTTPSVYDVFRSDRKIAFRNPMYSIKDSYSLADLAPPAP